jgi:alkylation response protein AidB-like acyl-CoA dehydrogenase
VDVELTEEQEELQRVVREMVEQECPPAVVRAAVDGDDEGTALWKALVQMELPGLTVPADEGGTGATAVELAIVLEQLGWAADPTPFLATTTQYLPLVRACAQGTARAAALAAVCSGRSGAAVFAAGTATARRDGEGWVLDGQARPVIDADRADQLAVVAATDDGVGLFLLPRADAATERVPAFDGSLHLAEVRFDGVRIAADRAFVGPEVAAGAAQAWDEAVTGLASVMVGASQRLLDLVLGQVRDRHQFGVPIGSFQAVKHMAVDVYVAIERARALCHFAALTIAEDDERRTLAASMAKAAAGDCQRIAAQHGVQLFGALGFTWENDLQLYLRRAKAGDVLLGTATEHRARLARIVLAARTGSAVQG